MNLIGARSLSRNSNVVITPAIPRNCSWGFVSLSQILMQNRDLLSGFLAAALVKGNLLRAKGPGSFSFSCGLIV